MPDTAKTNACPICLLGKLLTLHKAQTAALIVAYLLCTAGLDAFLWLVRAKPLPILSVLTGLFLMISPFLIMRAAFRGVSCPRRWLLASVIVWLVSSGTVVYLRAQAIATQRAPRSVAKEQAMQYFRYLWAGRSAEDINMRNIYSGKYHSRRLDDKTVLIWSEGPDHRNDLAAVCVDRSLFTFDRAFATRYKGAYSH